ncbi:OLC1v1010410C1 [Oldenlandia corymbosa var. corymbosa]|uniref:OLC1v1010410C1 n=1 Tax=Oldenlandia corymbosa var. corymbosa TaxID=529605 RepID=A0AAV1DUB0_OLDCO|nr:OLC1v1010410C1 [Oldenlandia corymbosa var. corymbosa]
MEIDPRSLVKVFRTLEALHLSGPFLLQDPTAVSLPKLEVLRLNFVQYGSDESVRKLVSGSPSLHTLWIHRYHYDGMAVCTISSPVLKYLDYSHGMCYGNNFHDVSHFKLVIDAPALGYLTLVNFSCDEISLMQKLTSLREVRLQTSPFMPCLEGEVAVGLVKAFGSRAEFMKLSYETMEALFSCTTTTKLSATFERLTVLDVQVDCFGLGDLMELIDCCPVLEVLQVQMLECVDPNIWRNPSSVPKCLLSSLKQVVYLGFEYHMDETSMLGFTVKHALVLETVDIICKTFLHLSGTITSFRKMLMSRRVSPTCRIDIS